MPATAKREGVWSDTELAKFLDKRIDQLSSRKTQREIAKEIGYSNVQIISMIKNGDSRLPLDRVLPFAKALEVDPVYLLRLAIEQQFDGETGKAVGKLLSHFVSEDEAAIIRTMREAAGGEVRADPEQLKKIQSIFAVS